MPLLMEFLRETQFPSADKKVSDERSADADEKDKDVEEEAAAIKRAEKKKAKRSKRLGASCQFTLGSAVLRKNTKKTQPVYFGDMPNTGGTLLHRGLNLLFASTSAGANRSYYGSSYTTLIYIVDLGVWKKKNSWGNLEERGGP